MNKLIIELLERVALTLDNYLGDTDPYLPEDYSDIDIRQHQPVYWCMKELGKILDEMKKAPGNQITGQASEEFEEAFRTGTAGCERTCACGKHYFDVYNTWDWNEGELEDLLKKEEINPDEYSSKDYSIGTLQIDGVEIVFECECGIARTYEFFIRNHAKEIAEYINKRTERLRKEALDLPTI